MSAEESHHDSAEVAARVERRWATISVIIIVGMAMLAAFAGIHRATMPQPRVETTDPSRLHLSGEFVESNLGSMLETNGSVTVRAIGQQYSFTPACILAPADTPITLRATSADVVHGILIQGTNVNTMLVPGYISEQPLRFARTGDYLMPCQEFCSFGHEGMWGKVKVIDKTEFADRAKGGGRPSCVGQ
ncbi:MULTISPECIES: cupredoxin domain-containing protein [Bradyrhizobium]|uniref:cytochrome c oxidase subunit II n=1 Tax=Bradyrhizobium TaxID=374 RepID=UPI0004270501|nr:MULTISPECIES: cytochrome c oxidase subunit II [Bradyrhizobium]WLB85565.1 cytochrome C oxidase subunit II [Bradyrhizobium japonicum USDA 135]GLR93537.1 cytochrome c oxidase subunit II [Bradyrhizobium liaoningense]